MQTRLKGLGYKFSAQLLLLASLLIASVISSSGVLATVNPESTNGLRAESHLYIVPRPFPALSLSGNMNFSNVKVGDSVERVLKLSCVGNLGINVYGINCPAGFSASWSGAMSPGTSQAVKVTFAPTAATNYSGTIVVDANAWYGETTINVTGTGIPMPTHLIALSGNLAFGKAEVGTEIHSTLTISNAGNSKVSIIGILYPSGFSGSWRGSLAPGAVQPITVKFKPSGPRTYLGEIQVLTTATLGTSAPMASGTGFVRPVLKIVNRPTNQQLTNAVITVKGTTEYTGKLAGVWYQLNGGDWNPAQTANNWKNWSATLALSAGNNTFKVYAQGPEDVCSTTNTLSFVSASTFKLQLSLATNGPPLSLGSKFSLHLSPNLTGHIQYSTNLTDWLDWTNFSGTNATLNFCDPSATNSPRRYYRAVIP